MCSARVLAPPHVAWFSNVIGARNAESITHEIIDFDSGDLVSIDGRVEAIAVIRVRYPKPLGGSPLKGSGIVAPTASATPEGELNRGGYEVMGYLIDINPACDE